MHPGNTVSIWPKDMTRIPRLLLSFIAFSALLTSSAHRLSNLSYMSPAEYPDQASTGGLIPAKTCRSDCEFPHFPDADASLGININGNAGGETQANFCRRMGNALRPSTNQDHLKTKPFSAPTGSITALLLH
jgi:hypothetical protein